MKNVIMFMHISPLIYLKFCVIMQHLSRHPTCTQILKYCSHLSNHKWTAIKSHNHPLVWWQASIIKWSNIFCLKITQRQHLNVVHKTNRTYMKHSMHYFSSLSGDEQFHFLHHASTTCSTDFQAFTVQCWFSVPDINTEPHFANCLNSS